MKRPEHGKVYLILPPAAIVDDAAFVFVGSSAVATEGVDTRGFRWARFRFLLGAIDVAFAVLPKIIEADVIAMTSPSDVPNAVLATVTHTTDDNTILEIEVPLEGRKRFLQAAATGGNGSLGTYMAALVELFGMENDPITASGYGLGQMVRGG